MWTDDYPTSSRICAKLKVSRVWTQLALESAEVPLGIAFQEAVTKLFFWGYSFTRLAPSLVIDIFRATQWNPAHNDSRQVLAYLSRVGASGGKNAAISQWLIVLLWSRCRNRKKARALVVAILEAIGRDTAARVIARPLYRLNLPAKLKPALELRNPHFRNLRRLLRRWRSNPAALAKEVRAVRY